MDLLQQYRVSWYLFLLESITKAESSVTRDRYAEHMRDVIMAIFGLSHTINTKVGNDFIRGVSGGERKRVSIAEAYVLSPKLQTPGHNILPLNLLQ
jgi:ABC-type multidrug transport system ATPase subunit